MSEPLRDREIDQPRAGWWRCPDCLFRRFFQTTAGAVSGAARHLKERHLVRLAYAPRHHGGLYGAGR